MKKIVAITLSLLVLLLGTSCGTFFIEPAPTPTPEPTLSVDEHGIPLDLYPTLANKVERTEGYKQLLKESSCKEENLDFCADLLYAIGEDRHGTYGFKDDRFDLMDRTVLANYLSEEEIYNFGRTGEGLQVIYFKDENGNNTNIPAICYVGGSETENISLDQLQGCIDFWIDKGATNFLEAMVENDVRIIFQNQANSEGGGHCVCGYGSNIIYCNSAQVDEAIIAMLTKAIAVEQFGVRGDSFGYDLGIKEVSVLKSRLARYCSLYMVKKFGVDHVYIDSFEAENERYMGDYLPNMSSEEFEELVQYVKDKNLMVPFVPASWEEIDAVIAEE